MRSHWSEERLAEAHRHELLKEAAQEYDLSQALPKMIPERSRPFYAPLLAALGRLMLAWGARLQNEYSA